jgi:hypothetical protein
MRGMDTAKLLIPAAVTLALSQSIRERQPAYGMAPVKSESPVMAHGVPAPAQTDIEPGDVGPDPHNAIPGLMRPGLAIPGVGHHGPCPICTQT